MATKAELEQKIVELEAEVAKLKFVLQRQLEIQGHYGEIVRLHGEIERDQFIPDFGGHD